MKQFTLFVLAIAAGALLMTSCGGGDGGAEDTSSSADLKNGKEIYDKSCAACHEEAVAGAAKLTNKERWQESADKGMSTLVKHVKQGYSGDHGVMPPKGNCQDCNETDLQDAVAYMLDQAGVKARAEKAGD